MCYGRHTMCMAAVVRIIRRLSTARTMAAVQAADVQKGRSVWVKTYCVCDVLMETIGLTACL